MKQAPQAGSLSNHEKDKGAGGRVCMALCHAAFTECGGGVRGDARLRDILGKRGDFQRRREKESEHVRAEGRR